MLNCPSCANLIPADVKSCPSCGQDLHLERISGGSGLTSAQKVQPKTSSMAVASLILSLFSVFPGLGILAIVFGHVSRSRIRRGGGKLKGKSLALAGLALGYSILIVDAIAISFYHFDWTSGNRLLKAIALVLSLFSLLLVPAILTIVFKHVSRARIDRKERELQGQGVGVKGLVFGCVGVACLLIIAIWVTRYVLYASRFAGQASVVGNLRTVNVAANTYASTYERGFPPFLAVLGSTQAGGQSNPGASDLVDELLASGHKNGYFFTYRVTVIDHKGFPSAYAINADPDPADPDFAGGAHYFTDESGVIRSERDHPANNDSQPIG